MFESQLTDQLAIAFAIAFFAFVMTMALTPIYTYFAYKHKLWKQKRTHSTTGEALTVVAEQSTRKRNVPTMAGLIVILTTIIITVLFNLDRNQTWLPLAALIGGAAIGIIDDIINVRGNGTGVAGLRAPIKFAMITAVAGIIAWYFYYKLGYSSIHIPFGGEWNLGWFIIPLFMLVIVSTGNAVNISDGLDGLAGGLLISSFGVFGLIAALQGNYGIAIFCMTLVGGLLAYTWFNIPPARFFMGDVGSFAFGTTLGVVAMLTNTFFLLPLIAIVFVIEAGSSTIQILSKKFFGRRVFISAPLHHHLQALEWPKTKVTMRFWVIGQVAAALGAILALMGGFVK